MIHVFSTEYITTVTLKARLFSRNNHRERKGRIVMFRVKSKQIRENPNKSKQIQVNPNKSEKIQENPSLKLGAGLAVIT